MEFFILSIGLLLLGAVLAVLFKEQFKVKIVSIFAFIASILAIIPAGKALLFGRSSICSLDFGSVFGIVNFVMDPLSAIFVIVISVMSFLGTVYASGYMKNYLGKGMHVSSHCFFLLMLIASMLSVVTIQNGLLFLVAWELMSLSSFFLVIFEGDKKEVLKSGIKYLVYMHFSVLFIIAMFAFLTSATGQYDFSGYARALIQNPQLANLAFILGFIGFGIKAGFAPFHNWLPDAHPATPTHVSGIMSGVMIKTGIYGILRVLLITGAVSKGIAYGVLAIAIVTALYGILYAVT